MILLALAWLLVTPAPTPDPALGVQTRIYYNARMALRDGRASDVLKLWLLRNTVRYEQRRISAHDADFRSVTWAALGALGLCQDGLPVDSADAGGAGLWPLAQHNWLVREMRRPPAESGGAPFDAFPLGLQQRFVSLSDVLDAEELQRVQFDRMGCTARLWLLSQIPEASLFAERRDRRANTLILRHLLRDAQSSLDATRVIGRSALAARIFDLDLRLVALKSRTARQADRQRRRTQKRLGLAEDTTARRFAPDSEPGRILKASLRWPAEEWLTLSSQRRQFLIGHAIRHLDEAQAAEPLLIEVIDALIAQKEGGEVQSWIAHLTAKADPADRAIIWQGERGARLLGLDAETGFTERGAIALHRGTHALATGRLDDALALFAKAMAWADDSGQADAVRTLARRWLSFVASRFRVTDALLDMLQTALPRADLRAVLDDQIWHATLQADEPSFQRIMQRINRRGAGRRRAEWMLPLAKGDADGFVAVLRPELRESPHQVLRFLQTYLARLQGQRLSVRQAHRPILLRVRPWLAVLASGRGKQSGLRRAGERVSEIDALLDGLSGAVGDAVDPGRRVFAGSLRVAPSDPLPWPFRVAAVRAPPVFTPIELRPIEWRDAQGALVFGWRVGDPPPDAEP